MTAKEPSSSFLPPPPPTIIDLSIVIPVYNEEACLETLYQRLTAVLDRLGCSFEIIFTNDGSQDRSGDLLLEFYRRRPQQIRIIEFNGNFGQHMAIMAAFERSRGKVIINMDADIQNPPEEIPKLLEQIKQGHDYVGGYRDGRKDSYLFRSLPSRCMNYIRGKVTDIHIRDQGCMMRAYSRRIVDLITQCDESSTFITALGYKFAINPIEIPVAHQERTEGTSKYDIYRLIRVTFDLFTGFSMAPLHVFTVFGFLVSGLSGCLATYLLIRRFVIGPEAEGLFTLFTIMFFLVSVAIMGIGIVGEYVGRIYEVVRKRPRFLIREIIETLDNNNLNQGGANLDKSYSPPPVSFNKYRQKPPYPKDSKKRSQTFQKRSALSPDIQNKD